MMMLLWMQTTMLQLQTMNAVASNLKFLGAHAENVGVHTVNCLQSKYSLSFSFIILTDISLSPVMTDFRLFELPFVITSIYKKIIVKKISNLLFAHVQVDETYTVHSLFNVQVTGISGNGNKVCFMLFLSVVCYEVIHTMLRKI